MQIIKNTIPNNRLFITQGYICRNVSGEIDNLQRGGSDYTASLLGSALNACEIQIWTDIDGLHNNDPRVVSTTAPVRTLTFDEASSSLISVQRFCIRRHILQPN